MSNQHLRLRQARLAAGYRSAADAARALGVAYPTYASNENGHSGLSAAAAELYARKFKCSLEWLLTGRGDISGSGAVPVQNAVVGLPVLGVIQAGHWLETSHMEEHMDGDFLPAARDERFPYATQYALRVVGDSMNLDYPDGSYVTCVDFAESGLEIIPGITVHVERQRAAGQLIEITLKRIELRGGKLMLVPRSTNTMWQPIHFTPDDTEVVIKGVVTGGWQRAFIPPRR